MAASSRCTPPEILLSGRVTADVTAVPESWNLTLNQAKNAPAHVALNTPAPSANINDANSAADSVTRALLAKARDCVVLDARYELAFEIVGGCPPYEASLTTTGDVDSVQPCLPRQGVAAVSSSKIYKGDAFPSRPPRRLKATLSVKDCRGQSTSRSIELSV
jgi:hypothetical protein